MFRPDTHTMAKPTGAHVHAAKQLLTHAGAVGSDREDLAERAAAAWRLYEKLFTALAPVIGAAGVRALFARSVKLTKAEFSCLAGIAIAPEPTSAEAVFTGSPSHSPPETNVSVARQVVDCLSKQDAATASEVAISLYATFFGLMSSFIGERLVWRLVKKAFPAMNETGPFKEIE